MRTYEVDQDLNDLGADQPSPRVKSVARAVKILMAIAQSENGLTTKEIAGQVDIGRQGVYHLLHTLVGVGLLTRSGNRYVLGLRAGTVAQGFARQLTPSEHLTPIVRMAAQKTGHTAYAAGWWSGEIIVLAVAKGTSPVQAAEVPQGYVGDAHARASGKLLLAFAPDAVRDAYLTSHDLRPLGPNTLTSRKELQDEFARIRQQVYAVDNEEFAPGLCCLAVPIDEGYSPFAIAVSAPRDQFLREHDQYLAAMRSIAKSVENHWDSQLLGYTGQETP